MSTLADADQGAERTGALRSRGVFPGLAREGAEALTMDQLPKTMRAAAVDRFGGPEVLTLHTVPVPEIGDDEVLIALAAAGTRS